MNRAPSKNDTWWAEHQRTCGGTYTKVKEPEDYGKKKGKQEKGQEDEKKREKGRNNLNVFLLLQTEGVNIVYFH